MLACSKKKLLLARRIGTYSIKKQKKKKKMKIVKMKDEVKRTGKEGKSQLNWFVRYASGICFWWVPLPSV